ncbi:cation-transporting P-type ATPase [Dolosicoccus paucivorans]
MDKEFFNLPLEDIYQQLNVDAQVGLTKEEAQKKNNNLW